MILGDRIAVMRAGVIQQIAEPMTLYHQPANLFVAGFIGSPAMNLFPGTIVASGGTISFQTDGGDFTLSVNTAMTGTMQPLVGNKIVLGLRPENISDISNAETAGEKVSAVAEVIEPLGAETFLYAKAGGQPLVARIHGSQRIAAKQELPLYFDMRHAHFFDPTTEKSVATLSGV
jgi:multiple sugar transport system ATP-binding protein